MKIARWGDSLAVRIPADVVDALQLKEGDAVDLHRVDDGDLGIRRRPNALTQNEIDPDKQAAALARMAALAAPLPPDYRFDRDDANAR